MKEQHHNPCSDCPWRVTAIAGWTGALTAIEWIQAAHDEATAECHVHLKGTNCAGLAIYRANVFKLPRDPKAFRLPADRVAVFTSLSSSLTTTAQTETNPPIELS